MKEFKEFPIDALNYLVSKVKALLAGKQDKLTFDSTPTTGSSNPVTSDGVKTAIDASNNTFIFEMVVSLSVNGVSLSLPQGVSYETIKSAIDKNMHVVVILEVPSVAGELAGVYVVPFTRELSSGQLGFSTTGEGLLMYMWVGTDSSVSFGYYNIERQSNKVTELSAESTDKQYPSAKAVYNAIAENANCFFYVPFKLGAACFELDGVTYAEIMAAHNEGKRIVGKGYVPGAAGLGFSGAFELPLSYLNEQHVFILTLISGQTTCEAWIASDNSITNYIRTLEDTSNKVASISASSTNAQYPSAKAVYKAIGFANGEEDMYI